jgi:hypothetical protein
MASVEVFAVSRVTCEQIFVAPIEARRFAKTFYVRSRRGATKGRVLHETNLRPRCDRVRWVYLVLISPASL